MLENILKDKNYLVGDKVSYADLSFVAWHSLLKLFPAFIKWKADYPRVAAWNDGLEARESFKRVLAAREEANSRPKVTA